MAFAINEDLLNYVPTIFDHGIEDFSAEITMAEADVIRYIQINWFNKAFSGETFNSALLTATQWNRSTVYYALYAYILPQLSPWRAEGDSFQEQITYYKNRFKEEIEAEMARGVEYDYNNDATVSAGEVFNSNRGRLWT